MKFTLVLVFALVCCSTLAIKPKAMSNKQFTRLAEIKQGKSWASILLNLAELHMMSKGPLEELVAAIEDTINDLLYQREKRDEAYVKRTEEHEAEVQRLEAAIARCEADIAETEDLLEFLAEQKAQLEAENAQLNVDIADAEVSMEEATRVRGLEHAEYETKIAETQDGIAAVEECLEILNEFAYGETAFVQMKSMKSKVSNAEAKIHASKHPEAPFLTALVQVMMNQEFADHGAVVAVINKFQEIRNNFYDAIGKMDADEANNQSNYERFMADQQQFILDCQETIEFNNGLLEENAKNTIENQVLLANLKDDLAAFHAELDAENESYENYQERYFAWCDENDREVAVCNEALDVVSTVDMADWIKDRVDAEDGLVSSGMAGAEQHGMGTEVFNFDYQF